MPDPKLPVSTESFWRTRINRAFALGKEMFTVIFNTDEDNWKKQQQQTTDLLPKFIKSGQSLLDAGCGIGMMWVCVPSGVRYHGVDSSSDFVQIAQFRLPNTSFQVGDLKALDFEDKRFDLAVCRSMKDMIVDNLGTEEWEAILKEVRRVSKKVLLLEYGDPMTYELLE